MIVVEEGHDARVRAAANGNLSEISSNGNATSGMAVAKRKGKAKGQGDHHNGVNEATELLTKRPTHQPAEFYHPVWSQSAWMYYDSVSYHSVIFSESVPSIVYLLFNVVLLVIYCYLVGYKGFGGRFRYLSDHS